MWLISLILSVAFPPPSLALITNLPLISTIVLDIGITKALPAATKPMPFTVPTLENVTPVAVPPLLNGTGT